MTVSSPELSSRLQAPLFQLMLVGGSCWLFLVAGLYRAVVRYIGAQTLSIVIWRRSHQVDCSSARPHGKPPDLGAAYAAGYVQRCSLDSW